MSDRPLDVPIILGTVRRGRRSKQVADFVLERLRSRAGVRTELIDIAELRIRTDDAGESIKDQAFSSTMARADGLVLVVPEYNHSFPGMLKHVMDSCYEEYAHKAVGVVAVSAGSFGGSRMTEGLLPFLRALGLVVIGTDVNFTKVQTRFDEDGRLTDESFLGRADHFLDELIWMATTLRHGRSHVPISGA